MHKVNACPERGKQTFMAGCMCAQASEPHYFCPAVDPMCLVCFTMLFGVTSALSCSAMLSDGQLNIIHTLPYASKHRQKPIQQMWMERNPSK